jgi:hypothetical protein
MGDGSSQTGEWRLSRKPSIAASMATTRDQEKRVDPKLKWLLTMLRADGMPARTLSVPGLLLVPRFREFMALGQEDIEGGYVRA